MDEIRTLDNQQSDEWKTIHLNLILDVGYPPHIDRKDDPYFSVFEETRHQLIKEDPHCWRCGSPDNLEAHHLIQWAYFNIIDGEKLRKDFPMYTGTTEDEKQRFLNSRYNIRLLCKKCHTGQEGIHRIPEPFWLVRRYMVDGDNHVPVEVREKTRVRTGKRAVRKVSGITPSSATAKNPLSGMRISSTLRKLLR